MRTINFRHLLLAALAMAPLAAHAQQLYQLHNNGWTFRYTGTPCSGESCTGWEALDNNPRTRVLEAAGAQLYQMHNNGALYKYTGTPCSGASCTGWQRLDNNVKTRTIAAGWGYL